MNEAEIFDEKTSEAILASAICMPGKFYESATSNIRKAQDKQRDFDRCHLSNSEIKMGDLTLLNNNKRKDKGTKIFICLTWSLHHSRNYTQTSYNA